MERMKLSKQDKPSAGEEAKIIFICEIGMRTLEKDEVNHHSIFATLDVVSNLILLVVGCFQGEDEGG